VKAVQLVRWQAEPELREVPVPEPGPGEVLVEIQAAGLCHSDLHIMEWPEGTLPWTVPFTLGHESAGVVAALGPGVTALAEGDPVLVYPSWGCGSCRNCLLGSENRCVERPARPGGGIGLDGGLAEYLLVPARRLLVPCDGLDPVYTAPLADAALTPYHAIKTSLALLHPGSSVVVIGVGGLGHVAVQLLRVLSATRIVAVDAREAALGLAREAGADAVFLSSPDLEPAEVRAAAGREGASLVLDFVAVDATLRLAASVLGTGGHVTVIGLGGGTFPMASGLPLEWSVGRISNGTIPELHEVVELARAGAINLEVEQLRLDDALEGYRRLRAGEVVGRAVVVP
jgi:propanol-preferring alcohol dehydrogenase